MTTVLNVNAAAQEQAAMHRTELLLASCRNCALPRVAAVGIQNRWHEQRQAHFLAWLEAGGFSQSWPERDQQERERAGHAPRDGGPATDPHAETDPAMLPNRKQRHCAAVFSPMKGL